MRKPIRFAQETTGNASIATLRRWIVRMRTSGNRPLRFRRIDRVIVTSHDAFGYFGRAYGFEVHGLQGISTASEAGTADVQQLADLVAARRIPAMFVETSISPRGIEAVQQAVRSRGFDVGIGGALYGDALGDPDSQAGTYLGMMRENIDTIVAALAGDPV